MFSSSSTAGEACGGGFQLLSLMFPTREMFQVPLLSRKSLFIFAFSKELGFGAWNWVSMFRGSSRET